MVQGVDLSKCVKMDSVSPIHVLKFNVVQTKAVLKVNVLMTVMQQCAQMEQHVVMDNV